MNGTWCVENAASKPMCSGIKCVDDEPLHGAVVQRRRHRGLIREGAAFVVLLKCVVVVLWWD